MPYLTTNDIRTHYEEDPGPAGRADPPLVLLHGFTGSVAQWAEVRTLLNDEHRIIAYDLRGHGSSDAPEEIGAYSIEQYSDDLLALLDHFGIEAAHIVGSAFGGMVALEFALRHPERLRTLVLSDPSAGPRCIELSEPIAAQEDGIDRALAAAREHGLSTAVEAALATSPNLRADPYRLERFHARWQRMSLPGFLGAGAARAARPDHHGDLDRLKMPVLIIVGDRDVLVPAAEYMHAHIAQSALRLIHHAGHPAMEDQPLGYVAVIRGFLAGLNPTVRARGGTR